MAKLFILLVASLCATLCAARPNYLQQLLALDESERLPAFDGTEVGYDHLTDNYYLNDDIVSREFARSKFLSTRVSLAGQLADASGRTVEQAVYPFAVGQKSMDEAGSNTDRWEVKSWDVRKQHAGIEFFGLFHGNNNNEFAVNRLRAHLLTNIANSVKDVLVVLDKMASDPNSNPSVIELLQKEANRRISQAFLDLDDSIGGQLADGEVAPASASVVIVTKKFLITANVGQGQIAARDSLGNVEQLSVQEDKYWPYTLEGVEDESEPADLSLFGVRSSQHQLSKPKVNIRSREVSKDSGAAKYKLVLIETPSVAKLLPATQAMSIVEREANKHGSEPKNEQAMYTAAVTGVLEAATSQIGPYGQRNQMDHSVMIIGLENEY